MGQILTTSDFAPPNAEPVATVRSSMRHVPVPWSRDAFETRPGGGFSKFLSWTSYASLGGRWQASFVLLSNARSLSRKVRLATPSP